MNERWRFGQFELDAPARELRKKGLRVHIQEQPCLVLVALLEKRGELVSREELRERLWPGDTFVDFERSLNAAVAKLRQVLSDSAEQPRYVETVARRGYRFVAPVSQTSDAADAEVTRVEHGVPGAGHRRVRWQWPAALLCFALVVLATVLYLSLRRTGQGEGVSIRFLIPPPEGTRIHPVSAVSPDGRTLAFVGIESSGRRMLWVRTLSSERAVRLEDTDDALAPFFSPDSGNLGFFAQGKLKRVPARGGMVQVLCEVHQGAGGTWSRENVILFSQAGRLYRVPATGGAPAEISRPDAAKGQTIVDTWPQLLEDGSRFVVRSRTYEGHLFPAKSEIVLGSLNSQKRQVLVSSMSRGLASSSGHLFFLRRGALLAQKVDFDKARVSGEPIVVADEVNMGNEGIHVDVKPGMAVGMGPGAFSVAQSGLVVHHSSPPLKNQLVWFSRGGKRLEVVGEPREYTQVALSPDEQWAAVGIRNRERQGLLDQTIWLMNLKTHVLSRLSYGSGQDADPVWSPDSRKVVYGAYASQESEKIDLMEAALGERTPKQLFSDGNENKPEAWSPDGRILLFRRDEQMVFALPVEGDRKPTALLETPHVRGRFRFSPDGEWLSYMSSESGQGQIYVSRYPTLTETRQVSKGDGWAAVWRKDGKELIYMSSDGGLWSVGIRASGRLETGTPKFLFRPTVRPLSANMGQFGVAENGQKFLVIESPPGEIQMHVISRWYGQ